jgi:hypothetical protein
MKKSLADEAIALQQAFDAHLKRLRLHDAMLADLLRRLLELERRIEAAAEEKP